MIDELIDEVVDFSVKAIELVILLTEVAFIAGFAIGYITKKIIH